jgi:hypothetical protein
MPAPRSIPRTLESEIICRWTNGDSIESIGRWISETNRLRQKPVETSLRSIGRLLERISTADDAHRRIAAIRQARGDAPFLLEELREIRREAKAAADAAGRIEWTPAEARRDQARYRWIAFQERCLQRQLRLAALTGPSAEALLKESEPLCEKYRAHVVEQSVAECEARAAADKAAAAGTPEAYAGPYIPGPGTETLAEARPPPQAPDENSGRFARELIGETRANEAPDALRQALEAPAPPAASPPLRPRTTSSAQRTAGRGRRSRVKGSFADRETDTGPLRSPPGAGSPEVPTGPTAAVG